MVPYSLLVRDFPGSVIKTLYGLYLMTGDHVVKTYDMCVKES